jgi:hypothetical protein
MDIVSGIGCANRQKPIVALGFVQQENRCAQETMKYMTANV